MRAIICIAFFGLTLSGQAQKAPKNEFSLGWFTAGYFFDSSAVRLSEFSKGRDIYLNYSRNLDNHFSIDLAYTSCYYQYVHSPSPQSFQDNTIFRRHFRLISIHSGYRISKWQMSAKVKAGINYRFNGEKLVQYDYLGGSWPYPYSVQGLFRYKEFGATLGLAVSHPIFWKLFGEIDCEYARMFPKAYPSNGSRTTPKEMVRADPQQLLLLYRIGVRF